jgi:hypothetical protein
MKLWLPLVLLASSFAHAQIAGPFLPKNLTANEKYLFYLHDGVVTHLGDNAVNPARPEWGPYQYLAILDSLCKRGFKVISENRKEGVSDSTYAGRIVHQIDTLMQHEVSPDNIIIVGASAGNDIVLKVSSTKQNSRLNYVIMGGCRADGYKDYLHMKLYGNFLSIIEATDPHGSCSGIFEKRKNISGFNEITLNTGLSHGFIYKGYKEWIDPLVSWFERR